MVIYQWVDTEAANLGCSVMNEYVLLKHSLSGTVVASVYLNFQSLSQGVSSSAFKM